MTAEVCRLRAALGRVSELVAAAEAELAEAAREVSVMNFGRDPRATAIAEMALEDTGYSLESIRGRRRDQSMVAARWRVMEAMHKAGYTVMAIGNFLNRDHTTVVYALQTLKEQRIQ